MEQTQTVINHSSLKCPYCHDSIQGDLRKKGCQDCLAWHHLDCWNEHGRCASCQAEDQTDEHSQPIAGNSGPVCLHEGCSESALNSKKAIRFSGFCATHGLADLEVRDQFAKWLMIVLTFLGAFCLYAGVSNSDGELAIGTVLVFGVTLMLLFYCRSAFQKARTFISKDAS